MSISTRSSLATRRVFLLHLCALLFVFIIGCSSLQGHAPRRLRVLFIGNSYTYVNDLPAVTKQLLAARGVSLDYEASTIGGATLEKHWSEGKALAAIRKGGWDVVILQEQSKRPFLDREAMFRSARLFQAEIKKTGARTVLYETWATKADPSEQPKLTAAYEALGRELGATVVPAGEAWKCALAAGVALHGPDGRHPNLCGTYLAACVFVHALAGQEAAGLPLPLGKDGKPQKGLSEAQAALLQRAADETCGAAKAVEVAHDHH